MTDDIAPAEAPQSAPPAPEPVAPATPQDQTPPTPAESSPADGSTGEIGLPEELKGKYVPIGRLNEVLRQKDFLAEQVRQRAAQPAEASKPEAPKALKRPTLEEFDYDQAKFAAAEDAYIEERAARAAEQTVTRTFEQQKTSKVEQERAARFQAFARETPDFEVYARNPELPIDQDMSEYIMDAKMGPQVLYYLGKNAAKAREIAMLPTKADKIEALVTIRQEISKPPSPKPSAAPPPPNPVGTSSSHDVDTSKMTGKEYMRYRLAQQQRR